MPDEHSLFSASGAEGWMVCHGKPVMEKGRKRSSEYADEGTAAHTLAQWVLECRLGAMPLHRWIELGQTISTHPKDATARTFIGTVIEVEKDGGPKRRFTVDKDMAGFVDDYVDTFMVMSQGAKVLRFAERRLNYASFLGVREDLAFGTGDANALIPDAPEIPSGVDGEGYFPPGGELQIHDFKYGMGVRVFAPGNPQLRLYGLGCLNEFELLADISRVRMVIHQPRLDHVSEEVISVADLVAWASEPRAAAQFVRNVVEYHEGTTPDGGYQHYSEVPESLAENLKASEKGCRFCDAKAVCPAMFAEAVEFGTGGAKSKASDFKAMKVDAPAAVKEYGDNWLAIAADKLDMLDHLRKAVRAEIDNRVLTRGLKVEGFKIVEGAMGDRKWSDPAAAEKIMTAAGVGDLRFTSKLVTAPQAEKALKKTFPAVWAALQKLIVRAPGAPSVVRTTDHRAEFVGHKAQASDFRDVSAGVAASSTQHPFRK